MVKAKPLSFTTLFSLLLKPFITLIIIFQFLNGENTDSGSTIPDLKVRLLDGTSTTLHQLSQDGPLLIDFWATWCVPCKKVMKYLNQYHEEYASDNFKVLMINTDTPRSLGKVRGFIKSQDYSFNVGMDPNKVLSKKLNGMIMPTLILVDKGGIIKWRHQGYVAGEEIEIEKQIKQVLGNNINENIN
jgi:thiol-disulfide isomerase/thioredoxin